ncbi:MAG: hypothetical protein L0H79_21100 [Intrasporangium sp.]|uniref:hypothetical protein n=1 Tax=Intrasporangium sp. TaxID=1925024 RepID=UPI0026472A7D|nr:hypothetical protein [Intrasporangium sp.]MDN5798225.1 hypothetical protein [Intrasporangium sp.]
MTTPGEQLLAVIGGQHARIRALLTVVATPQEADRLVAFDHFLRFLAVHEAAEQTLLHPQGLVTLSHDDVSARRITEEQEAAAVIAHLESIDDPRTFLTQFGLLGAAVTHHAEAEEQEELPELIAALPDDTIEQILEGFARVEPWADELESSPLQGAPTFEAILAQARAGFVALAESQR